MPDAAENLGRRLLNLREREFPNARLTQGVLANALGGGASVSTSAVSTWESGGRVPSPERLETYARFFATPRSVDPSPPRLLDDDELTPAEQQRFKELRDELLALRKAALAQKRSAASLWRFGNGAPVSIVCPEIRDDSQTPPDVNRPKAHRLGHLDALLELYGQIRAENPTTRVGICTIPDVRPRDLIGHVVVVGAWNWNGLIKKFGDELPVRRASVPGSDHDMFVVKETRQEFRPEIGPDPELGEDGKECVLVDYALFARGLNPYNTESSLTIIDAAFTPGVWGAVLSFTDPAVREENELYVARQFAGSPAFSLVIKVDVHGKDPVPRSLNQPGVVRHVGRPGGEGAEESAARGIPVNA